MVVLLVVSDETVKSHVAHIINKLQVRSRHQVAGVMDRRRHSTGDCIRVLGACRLLAGKGYRRCNTVL
ncbi:response regulator transcription factor [bacterium]|nr:response regulator transcription factor [bacterium]